ncbi:MAG: hypothetical protein AAGC68_15380, partial [Verrucomicrobiota bacterium]
PGQALADPGQASVDPATGYPPQQQPAADPGQVYIDPATGYPAQAPTPSGDVSPPGQGAGIYDEVPQSSAPAQQPSPVRSGTPGRRGGRPPARKTTARRSPQRRPVASGSRRSSGGYRPPKSYGGGLSMMTVFLGLVAIALIGLIIVVALPSEEIKNVNGYGASLVGEIPAQNLLEKAQKVMIDRDNDLVLSEQEVNTYLAGRLQGMQEGLISAIVKYRGTYVDFSPGIAEIFVEREVFGQPITMSSRISAEEFRGKTVYKSAGWSIGRLSFNSRNIKPIVDMFFRLRETCQDEMLVLNNLVGVRFEDDQLILDATL